MAKPSYVTLKERADAEAAAIELSLEEEQQRMKKLLADHLQEKEAKAAREVKVSHIDRGQIHRSKVIDPQEGRLATVTPIGWVTLTPSMCQADPRCSFDGAEAIGWPNGYDSIPEDLILPWNGKTARWYAENTLERHIVLRHATTGPSHVRTPEQVKVAQNERLLPDTFIENPRL
jgi:hypothetical protein